jgi:hypothetical protein
MTRGPDPTLATLYRLAAAPAAMLRRLRAPEAALARLAPDLEALDLCRSDAAAALLDWPAVAAQIQPAIDRLGTGARGLPEPPVVRPPRETAPPERHRTVRRPPSTARREAERRRVADLLETYAAGRRNRPALDLWPTRAGDADHRRPQSFDGRAFDGSAFDGRAFDGRVALPDRSGAASDAPIGGNVRAQATPATARHRLRRAAERSGAPGAAHRVVAITGAGATPEAALASIPPAAARPGILPPPGAGLMAEIPPRRSSPRLQAAGEPAAARLVAALGALEIGRAQRRAMRSNPEDSAISRADAAGPVSESQGPSRPAPPDLHRPAPPSVGLRGLVERGLVERTAAPAARLDQAAGPSGDNRAPVSQPTRETLTRHIADILRHEARRHGIEVDEAGP